MSYQAKNLPAEKHIFLGREGGVSTGKYESLNVLRDSQDDEANVIKNRTIAVQSLGGKLKDLMLLNQQSATDVCFVESPSQEKVLADGMVTKTPGIILGLYTADCTPVLFADYESQVIGAAHAGWRGAVRGVLENTLRLMIEKGAKLENIAAALGPCMQQASFEVGAEVREECRKLNPEYVQFFAPGKDNSHYQFDLEGLIVYRLQKFGVKNISASRLDTYAREEEYFSFRRNTHRGLIQAERDFPCHISLIKL